MDRGKLERLPIKKPRVTETVPSRLVWPHSAYSLTYVVPVSPMSAASFCVRGRELWWGERYLEFLLPGDVDSFVCSEVQWFDGLWLTCDSVVKGRFQHTRQQRDKHLVQVQASVFIGTPKTVQSVPL